MLSVGRVGLPATAFSAVPPLPLCRFAAVLLRGLAPLGSDPNTQNGGVGRGPRDFPCKAATVW